MDRIRRDAGERWRLAGVPKGEVARWDAAGYTPEAAGAARDAGQRLTDLDDGYDEDEDDYEDEDDESPTWDDFGLGTRESREWSESGLPPRAASRYIRAGIDVEAACSWDEAGFTARSAVRWAALGLSPAMASAWLDLGLPRSAVHEWRSFGIEPSDGLRWMLAGCAVAEAADERAEGRVPPDLEWDENGDLVDEWRGVSFADRVTWRSVGVRPEDARDWNNYLHADDEWSSLASETDAPLELAEAITWASLGFSVFDDSIEYFEIYRSVGLRPHEAVGVRDLLLTAHESNHFTLDDLERVAAAARSIWAAGVPLTAENLVRWGSLTGDQVLEAVDRGLSDAEEYRLLADLDLDVSQVETWRSEGLAAERMRAEWLASRLGLGLEIAALWGRSKFTVDEILAWHASGLDPDGAAEWTARGFLAAQALSWRANGIERPQAAEAWAAQSFQPAEAGRWAKAEFDPCEAAAWGRAGIDAPVATRRRKAGIEPPR